MARPAAPARPSTPWLRSLGALGALVPTQAFAGAWIAPEGGQEIWSTVVGEREDVSFYETSAYWELPVAETTSVVASPWLEQNYDNEDGWRAEAAVGVKQAVFRDDHFAVAVSASALWESDPDPDCSEGGVELRALAGGSASGGRAFANVEVAGRALEGGCTGARAEFTAGYHADDHWLTLAQLFVDASGDGEETVRGQLSLVRVSENGRGIQLGVRARMDGEEEYALVLGLWGRPGNSAHES